MDKQVERVQREVKIPLSEEQLNERREENGEMQSQVDEAENTLAEITEEFNKEKGELKTYIEARQEKIAQNNREVKAKKAKMLTDVDEVQNFETKEMEYWYPKFGPEAGNEMVDRRPFTPEEHQVRMFKQKAEDIPSTGSDIFEDEMGADVAEAEEEQEAGSEH